MKLSELREQHEMVEQAMRSTGHREGRDIRVLCPFCTSSKTGRADYSLSVNATNGLYHCHRCEVGGRLSHVAGEFADDHVDSEVTPTIMPPDGYMPLWCEPAISSEMFAPAREYATKRGMPKSMCRTLQVGAVLEGRFSGRIVVPMLDVEGTWVGWIARDWTGHAERKYLYPKGMARDQFWNHGALHEDTTEPLLVVEGVLDAVPFWPDAVAMLGKVTAGQKQALLAITRPIALVFDGDAWRDARTLATELRMFHDKRAGYVRLPARKDPDEMDPAWLRERARECLDEALL
jgi:DNA primase